MRGFLLFLIGLAAYAGMLIFSQWLLSNGIEARPARILIALSPMLPAAFICWVIVHSLRNLDEMQRQLQYEALAISFMGTAFITFSYGFLEGVGFPKLSMFSVWGLMGLLWFICVMIGRFRYR